MLPLVGSSTPITRADLGQLRGIKNESILPPEVQGPFQRFIDFVDDWNEHGQPTDQVPALFLEFDSLGALIKQQENQLASQMEEERTSVDWVSRGLLWSIAVLFAVFSGGALFSVRAARRAESLSRESESRFRHLTGALNEVFWISSPDQKETFYVSPAYEALWGRSCQERYDHPNSWFDAVHPEDRDRVLDALRGAASRGYDEEFRVLRPDGTVRWVRDRAAPIPDDRGGILYLAGVSEDVTAQKQAEESQRTHEILEERLLRIATLAPGVFHAYRIGPDGHTSFPYASPKVIDLYGFSAEDLAKDASLIISFIHPDDVGRVAFEISQSARELTPLHCSYRLQHPSRGELWLEVSSSPKRDPDGGTTWSGFISDITERKLAKAAFLESQARFEQVAAHIREVFWLFDVQQKSMLYLSPAFFDIWGRSPEEVYRDPTLLRRTIHPDDQSRVSRALLMVIESAVPYDEEFRVVRPNGTERWVRDRAFPVLDEAGCVVRMVGITDDITEHRLLEAQLRHSQKMEAVGNLAGGVAHDFNNLLSVIQCSAELLLLPALSPDELQSSAQDIVTAANRAANLTRQLLMFSRKHTTRSMRLDLNQTVVGVIQLLHRVLGENISLRAEYDPAVPSVRGDAQMLEQVVMNLAVNARDAMPKGGELHIRTSPQYMASPLPNPEARPGLYACIVVRDSGSGIAPEHLPHIFEPFFTTKAVGKGTGLGLATVYGIVRQHGGWIEAQSELGKGASFLVYLPADHESGSQPALLKDRSATTSEMPRGTETILCVEDEGALAALVNDLLQRCGYHVLRASSGEEALVIWQEHQTEISLLLTDLVMPGTINGRELAEQIHQSAPSLPVIYTSGYASDVAGDDLELIDGVNFLPKPYPAPKLAQMVRTRLDESAKSQSETPSQGD